MSHREYTEPAADPRLSAEIGERRRAEEALRTFIAHSTEGVSRFETREPIPASLPEDAQIELMYRHGRLVECNDAFARMYGAANAAEMVGAPLSRMLIQSDPRNTEYLQSFIRSGYRIQDAESCETDLQGNLRWFSNGLTGILENGQLIRVWCTQRDITERKRMQEDLRQAAEQWQATFDSIEDLVMVLDRDYRIIRVNASAVKFFQLPPEKILGNFCYKLMHGDARPNENCPSPQAMCAKAHREAEIYEPQCDLWFLISADPILDQAGEITSIVHTVKDITARKRAEQALQTAFQEIHQLKDRIEAENVVLREEVLQAQDLQDVVGQSKTFQLVLGDVAQVAPTDTTVLLLGETGTGKEVIARAIHARSSRKDRPLISVNCAALPAALTESELFGHEKGAFTGALTRQLGRFEVADHGTLLLDEIGELAPELQAKLLRVLQEGTFERVGSSQTVRVDVRLIAASNRDLAAAVRQGRFRADLYYRLNVFPISIPPLRERRDDIPLLVWHFIARKQRRLGTRIEQVPPEVMQRLQAYNWPGNIRELENVIEQALIRSPRSSRVLDEKFILQRVGNSVPASSQTLEEAERALILNVLAECGWRIKGPGNTAARLGLKPSTLYFRLKKLGISRPKQK